MESPLEYAVYSLTVATYASYLESLNAQQYAIVSKLIKRFVAKIISRH